MLWSPLPTSDISFDSCQRNFGKTSLHPLDCRKSLPHQHHHRLERVRLLHQTRNGARQEQQRWPVVGMFEYQPAENAAGLAELAASEFLKRVFVAGLQLSPAGLVRFDELEQRHRLGDVDDADLAQ